MRRIPTTALAVSAAVAVWAIARPTPATAQVVETTTECKVLNVAVYQDRVHIRCGAVGDNVWKKPPEYLAIGATNPLADRLLILGSEALIHNRPLTVTYDWGTDGQPPGCLVADCRRLIGLVLK